MKNGKRNLGSGRVKAALQRELFGETAEQKLRRLRTYVLPLGLAAASREACERWLCQDELLSEADACMRLNGLEKELQQLGGRADASMADMVERVERVFPGAEFLGVRPVGGPPVE